MYLGIYEIIYELYLCIHGFANFVLSFHIWIRVTFEFTRGNTNYYQGSRWEWTSESESVPAGPAFGETSGVDLILHIVTDWGNPASITERLRRLRARALQVRVGQAPTGLSLGTHNDIRCRHLGPLSPWNIPKLSYAQASHSIICH